MIYIDDSKMGNPPVSVLAGWPDIRKDHGDVSKHQWIETDDPAVKRRTRPLHRRSSKPTISIERFSERPYGLRNANLTNAIDKCTK